MATRNYSPFAPRSYAPKSRGSSPLSSFAFLTTEKTKNLHIGLWVIALVFLALALFFSYCMYLSNKFSPDQIMAMYPKLATSVAWVKTTAGKVVLASLWVVFGLTVLPIGAGTWFRGQQKRFL